MNKKFLAVTGVLAVFGLGYFSGQSGFAQADKAPSYLPPEGTVQQAYNPSEDLQIAETLARASARKKYLTPDSENNNLELARATRSIAKAYLAGANDKTFTQNALARASRDWEVNSKASKTAAQISQTADEVTVRLAMLEVAQNQRIIELLTQLNAKK